MRNMSFFLTTEQMRAKTKTETRRLGWFDLKPGEIIQACVKCQGLKKGEKIERIGLIEIVSVRTEDLSTITRASVDAEGFGDLTPAEFVEMFATHNKCRRHENVTVIKFRHVNERWMDEAAAMSEIRDPNTDQPLPKPGGQSVTDALIADLHARREMGRRKYGDELRTHNGRDAGRDLYEELLDAVLYAKQLRMERDNGGSH